MDSALACCAGGPGSIPTNGIFGSSCNIQMIFLPLGLSWQEKWNQTRNRDLAIPECREKQINPSGAIYGRTWCKSDDWEEQKKITGK